jgi:hypothetical protein
VSVSCCCSLVQQSTMLACHRVLRLHATQNVHLISTRINVLTGCHHRSFGFRLCCTAETSSQSVRELASDPEQGQTVRKLSEDSARSSDSRSSSSDRRTSSSSSSSAAAAASAAVAQSRAAAAAGKLPDVLAATFPETFPTLSAARRGKAQTRVPHYGASCLCTTAFSCTVAVQHSKMAAAVPGLPCSAESHLIIQHFRTLQRAS